MPPSSKRKVEQPESHPCPSKRSKTPSNGSIADEGRIQRNPLHTLDGQGRPQVYVVTCLYDAHAGKHGYTIAAESEMGLLGTFADLEPANARATGWVAKHLLPKRTWHVKDDVPWAECSKVEAGEGNIAVAEDGRIRHDYFDGDEGKWTVMVQKQKVHQGGKQSLSTSEATATRASELKREPETTPSTHVNAKPSFVFVVLHREHDHWHPGGEPVKTKGVYCSQADANKAAETEFDEATSSEYIDGEEVVLDRSLWPQARKEYTKERFRSSTGEMRFVRECEGDVVWYAVERRKLL
ncbi:hypothetical protein LTR85_010379 [Meristemomyces frigidus]|nr:hypothetical protein LTR85_010379 [Meristemomyces frigidus]